MALMARFNLGDRVVFQTSTGERKSGTVIRLNKKTASVATDDGHQWNVPPGMLSRLGSGDVEPRR